MIRRQADLGYEAYGLTDCGLSGLMHVRLLLTQHFLLIAADFMLRCSLRRGSGHSMLPMSVDFRPTFRRILNEPTECGLSGHLPMPPIQVQKPLTRGTEISTTQRFLTDWSFKPDQTDKFQTAFSLRSISNIESRKNWAFIATERTGGFDWRHIPRIVPSCRKQRFAALKFDTRTCIKSRRSVLHD